MWGRKAQPAECEHEAEIVRRVATFVMATLNVKVYSDEEIVVAEATRQVEFYPDGRVVRKEDLRFDFGQLDKNKAVTVVRAELNGVPQHLYAEKLVEPGWTFELELR